MSTEKPCTYCNTLSNEFAINARTGRRQTRCIPCAKFFREEQKVRRTTEKGRQKSREAYLKSKATRRKLTEDDLQKKSDKHIEKKYGLSPEAYTQMVLDQQNQCAICGTTNPGGQTVRKWHVDHDHKTGKVRGLLCFRCNIGLGYFLDDPDALTSAARYLLQSINVLVKEEIY